MKDFSVHKVRMELARKIYKNSVANITNFLAAVKKREVTQEVFYKLDKVCKDTEDYNAIMIKQVNEVFKDDEQKRLFATELANNMLIIYCLMKEIKEICREIKQNS